MFGSQRVIARSDCKIARFVGFGATDPAIVPAKSKALAAGVAIASTRAVA